MNVTALVLAAGSSRRMERPKALVEWRGETFLARVVRTLLAGGVSRVLVVVGGPHADEIARAAGDLAGPVTVVPNPDPTDGPVTSVRCGLRALGEEGEAVLVQPVDIPGITAEDVRAVLAAAGTTPAPDAVVPSVAMRRGHPLILRRALAARLLAPDGPPHVRALLAEAGVTIEHVVRENRALLHDVDTPEDLAALDGVAPADESD